MNVHSNSAWSREEIFRYLDRATTPLRISCNDDDDYPVICSLWFVHNDGVLWAASHKSSHIVKALGSSPRIGFEVATNEYPYHGVRGKADVTLLEDRTENVLEKVIDKYLQGSNTQLASWLLSRKDDEYAIRISPVSINSWDYSRRMARES
ncbi:MAG: hypothetical protein Hals2KO_12870 [Halioglobus sp.]